MTEQELRAIVRDVVARQMGTPGAAQSVSAGQASGAMSPPVQSHASHAMFVIQGDPEGRCIIEPSVACTHCGYCKSYGH